MLVVIAAASPAEMPYATRLPFSVALKLLAHCKISLVGPEGMVLADMFLPFGKMGSLRGVRSSIVGGSLSFWKGVYCLRGRVFRF